ncbi:hypothetical protein V6U90_32020 [Micromonospora sp. CPCC 206060]|uniref:hypothetical protein n=1 Tax=Micromonospora sp. CPCC 206060 TaxID=3122406 RepID=UPI002FEF7F3A
MTTQRPDQGIWPFNCGDVPARAPGRAPAVTPTQPASRVPSASRAAAPNGYRPKAGRVRVVAAILAGAAVGAGITNWTTSPSAQNPTMPHPTEAAEDLFDQRQASVNRSQIPTQQLAEFAAPWLARIGNCTSNTASTGQQPGDGEQTRTRCTAGIVTVYWISYRNLADRDAAHARYVAQAARSQDLAPGMQPPTPTTTGHTAQLRVEYAYRVPTGTHTGQTVAALWWSDPAQPVAGVLTAYWTDGLGSSWGPLRDLWHPSS